MPEWGDHKEYQKHRVRRALNETQYAGSKKWFSFASQLSRPEMILLVVLNTVIVAGVIYLIIS